MVSAAGSQMVRDVVSGTGATVRELSGWISFGLLPLIAYLYDRPRWLKWTAGWVVVSAGWALTAKPGRGVWESAVIGGVWIALALLTHGLSIALRFSARGRKGGLLRLLLVGWTAAIILHPAVVLYRVSRDWYDCPCQKQKLK